jgi:hypothetical protein
MEIERAIVCPSFVAIAQDAAIKTLKLQGDSSVE